jgi:hypothetical protein
MKNTKSIIKVDVVTINKYDTDKQHIFGEWFYHRVKLFGIPIYVRTYRRDTTQEISAKRRINGFKI